MSACCEPVDDGCAATTESSARPQATRLCPGCGTLGKPVELITLKSLLRPPALERLDPGVAYFFCENSPCEVVYFASGLVFSVDDVKVPVFQKDPGLDVPVCYCFGWTRRLLADELAATGQSTAAAHISGHVRAGRCGCEVNNPQGSCCLGNVRATVKALQGAGQPRG